MEYIIDGQIYGLNVKVYDEKAKNDNGKVVVNGDGSNSTTINVQSVINEFRPQGMEFLFCPKVFS